MIYTADLFHKDCQVLAERVSSYQFTHILSVIRGGWYVAEQLAWRCADNEGVFLIPIGVSYYEGKVKQATPKVTYTAGIVFGAKDRVLIVDDLLDSGDTIKYLKNHHILKKAGDVKVAVLIKKPTSVIEPDFCVRHNVTSWVRFPWEDANGNHYSDLGVSHTGKLYASA
jgi:hypoxanthine phosphoribosyltransferase